jgi:hypothetical protein
MTPRLMINGVVVALESSESLSQRYGWVGGFTNDRMMDGSLDGQQTWRKRSTTITGAGWIPPALEGIDWSAPVTVDCVQQVAINSPAAVIVLPTARRADVAPFAFAVMADVVTPHGQLVPTPSSLAGDVLTITPVAGALAYQAVYYPRLVCRSAGQTLDQQINEMRHGFELVLEEV